MIDPILFKDLEAKDPGGGTAWVSEKDLPGGAAFFRGPHLPLDIVYALGVTLCQVLSDTGDTAKVSREE